MNARSRPGPMFVDNPLAPEVFCEGAAGYYVSNGNVHITLMAQRANHDPQAPPGPGCRVVVIPIAGAQLLATELYNFLKQGEPAPAGSTQLQ
jgi:hypothetical protein